MRLSSIFSCFRSVPAVVLQPWFHALLVIVLLTILQKPFFYPDVVDGFSFDMRSIPISTREEWGDNQLYWVQVVRFITIYPFWLTKDMVLAPLFNALCVVSVLLPLVSCSLDKNKPAHPLRCLLFYVSLVTSFRAVLVMTGVGYMFLMFFGRMRSGSWMVLSLLLANLSSASLIIWLLGMVIQFPQFRCRPSYYILLLLAVLSLSASLSHKIPYFSEIAVSEQTSARAAIKTLDVVDKVINVATERNTIVTSRDEGNTVRAAGYIAIFILLVYAIIRCASQPALRWNIGLFLLGSMPMFLLEGLGVLSLLGPLVILLSEWLRKDMVTTAISPYLFRAGIAQ